MLLKDFTFDMAKMLIDYSDMINRTISLYKTQPSIGEIGDKDFVRYWENNVNYICYDRHLQFENGKVKIKFCTGLYFTKTNTVDFIVWFKKAEIPDYVEKLRDFPESKDQYHESTEEVWISMEKEKFEKICDNTDPNKEATIKDFWDSVFEVLK